ncbi:hypothetical protein ACFV1W_30205 [Kitasatospora sp. NPDC059648]|uniref:nucleotide-binding protein n=1 Tax=Kitasatospora sp. NPDC059648 TaxID=3346894 RepID=UPI00369C0D33
MAKEHPPWDGPPTVIAVFGGKGGIGKSTLAFLIAWLLGLLGRTLLIDADKRQEDGSSAELYNLLQVTPSFDLALEEDPQTLGKLKKLRGYRWVVIDNAPHRDEKLKATCAGDLIVVPLTLDYLEARAVMSSLRAIVLPSGRPYRVVLSKVASQHKAKAMRTQESLDVVGINSCRTHMRKLVAHQTAGQLGIPITEGTDKTWREPANDARDLVDELLEALGEDVRVPRPEKAVAR